MAEKSTPPADVTSDDKLWAALAYVFSPIVPIILLLIEGKKDRPFIKAHNVQALVAGIAVEIIIAITGCFTFGLTVLLWILLLYWAYKAYKGEYVTIPVVTDFVKNQGWA
jgi:uncharacterized membrane protein